MTEPSRKLKTTEEKIKASKRGTWKPADPNAPVTIVIGSRPKNPESPTEENPAEKEE